jgi:hypothetical protein
MRPTTAEIISALRFVGATLDAPRAEYCFEGRFRFRLDNDWSIVLSADDAGRFRLDACYRSRARATMWTASADRARLKALVLAARDEAAVLIA